jgi:hypothetical protein
MITELHRDWAPSELTLPFWTAAREGRLVLQRCRSCGAWQHPPRPVCLACGDGSALDWEPVSGAGTVFSVTTVERALIPGLRGEVPYLLALVQLEEGVRVLSLLTDCAPEAARIDLPVRVVFRPFGDERLPCFTPR